MLSQRNLAFAAAGFAEKPGSSERLLAHALPLIASRSNAHILDLGCGTGATAIAAVKARSDLRATGIDISRSNVAAFTNAAALAGVSDRVITICGDYLTTSLTQTQYDLIVSDSVLQFIDGTEDALAARLARDLKPGGVLVAATAIQSIGNTIRVMLRRAWRMLPERVDGIPLALAQCLWPHVPKAILADRVMYLRVLPVRLFGPDMRAAFSRHGLDVERVEQWPSESAAKLAHALIIWRRH